MQGELGKKSEPQMGFEPTTLRDLVGCSNHRANEDSILLHKVLMQNTLPRPLPLLFSI